MRSLGVLALANLLPAAALLVALFAQPSAAYGQTAAQKAAAEVHRRGGYTDQLPILGRTDSAGGEGAKRGGLHSDSRERHANQPRRPLELPHFNLALPSWFSQALTILFVTAVLVLLVVAAVTSLARRRGMLEGNSQAQRPALGVTAVPDSIRWVEEDPDELAAAGRYEEALAALLVRSLMLVGWRRSGSWRGRTAREVLGLLGHGDPRRPYLEGVVETQELVAFAGFEPTRERFEVARSSWLELRGLSGGGPHG